MKNRVISLMIAALVAIACISMEVAAECPDGYTQDQCNAEAERAEKENKEAREAQGD